MLLFWKVWYDLNKYQSWKFPTWKKGRKIPTTKHNQSKIQKVHLFMLLSTFILCSVLVGRFNNFKTTKKQLSHLSDSWSRMKILLNCWKFNMREIQKWSSDRWEVGQKITMENLKRKQAIWISTSTNTINFHFLCCFIYFLGCSFRFLCECLSGILFSFNKHIHITVPESEEDGRVNRRYQISRRRRKLVKKLSQAFIIFN